MVCVLSPDVMVTVHWQEPIGGAELRDEVNGPVIGWTEVIWLPYRAPLDRSVWSLKASLIELQGLI